jgi:integrase
MLNKPPCRQSFHFDDCLRKWSPSIDAETVKVLKRWRPERGSAALDFTRADAVVFSSLDGSPRNPTSVSMMFTRRVTKARKALGTDALPVITLRGLRHTHATVLLEAGEDPKVVQERLGHTTFTTTMGIYSKARELHQMGAFPQVAS